MLLLFITQYHTLHQMNRFRHVSSFNIITVIHLSTVTDMMGVECFTMGVGLGSPSCSADMSPHPGLSSSGLASEGLRCREKAMKRACS